MPEKHHTSGDIRAALYLRKSTDEQEQSIDRQRDAVTRYAAGRGYHLTHEYVDEGIAGDVFDRRPDFQKMLAAAAREEFDVILVDEPSRLSRQNPIELIEKVIAPLRRSGTKIDTASKGPLDYESLAGIIMMTVHAHKSADEAVDLSRRVLGGMIKKAKDGLFYGWICPYGLRIIRTLDPDTGKVTARQCVLGPEEEVRAVRFIFDCMANRGWSLRHICRELEARGVRPPKGNGRGANKATGHWNSGTVRKMLLNRKYVGDLSWNETHVGKYSLWKGGKVEQPAGVNRRVTRNDPADLIIVPDVIPPLIDRDTFARAGMALARQQKCTSSNGEDARYLFTRMLVCGDCGSFMRGQPIRAGKGYICARYKEYGTGACHRNTVTEARLWLTVLQALRNDILSPERLDAVEAEVERRLQAERSSGEAQRLQKRIAALDRDIAQGNARLVRLPEDRLPGVIAQIRNWEDERARLVSRQDELANGADRNKAIFAEARRQLWRLRESLEGGDTELQATVVREMLSKVEVRFGHERTHGRRSPTGKGRNLSKPARAVLHVRPGLGLTELSCLFTPDCRNRAPGGGRGRASSFPPPCASPG
jgi:DNA invertase Pin-like site-specific DNA recombinase